jgi:hypothetical protein
LELVGLGARLPTVPLPEDVGAAVEEDEDDKDDEDDGEEMMFATVTSFEDESRAFW